ncbi:MAG: GNAT family N-acetyltransferase, partial [Bdellovibrionales bacterium]|nr:GNAT family N-acetyltransferase [Bdellovibrionales bacterium]
MSGFASVLKHFNPGTHLNWGRDLNAKFFLTRLSQFQPKYEFTENYLGFRIRTAKDRDDVLKALTLRGELFNPNNESRHIDFDGYDLIADHILLEDIETGEIVGTYRMLCSTFADRFYSESEFELDELFVHGKRYLELGRACIKKE